MLHLHLYLHHRPQGEAYVTIELVPLREASGEQAWFVEKIEPLRVAQGDAAAQGLIGRAQASQQMLELVARVARVGPSRASVLLLSESGTGKELVARAVHEASPRAAAPLVVVDCASLAETLFGSEVFGHERGAFTGVGATKLCLVEAASGGTLFLDEVGDIPPGMQVKLLRLLGSDTYRRVGSTELRCTDVRVVSATHRDLAAKVAGGRFRDDLYYRLATFPIRLPVLRERAEDIPLLAAALLARVVPDRPLALLAGALQRLAAHAFPGNVRELRKVLERAALLCDGTAIEDSQVERAFGTAPQAGPRATPAEPALAQAGGQATKPLRQIETEALRAQLAAHHGSRAELACSLGMSERSPYRKLRALAAG